MMLAHSQRLQLELSSKYFLYSIIEIYSRGVVITCSYFAILGNLYLARSMKIQFIQSVNMHNMQPTPLIHKIN